MQELATQETYAPNFLQVAVESANAPGCETRPEGFKISASISIGQIQKMKGDIFKIAAGEVLSAWYKGGHLIQHTGNPCLDYTGTAHDPG